MLGHAFDDREYREALLFRRMLQARLLRPGMQRLTADAVRGFSRSQRTRHRLLRLEELTTRHRWTVARRLLDLPWDASTMTGTEMEIQHREQAVLISIGQGRLAEAAQAQRDLADLARRRAPHPVAAALPSTALMWLVTDDKRYGDEVLDGLHRLEDLGGRTHREAHARILAAEGLRRRGDLRGALAELPQVMTGAEQLSPQLLMLAAPVIALLAEAPIPEAPIPEVSIPEVRGAALLSAWNGIRNGLGLPLPIGLPPGILTAGKPVPLAELARQTQALFQRLHDEQNEQTHRS